MSHSEDSHNNDHGHADDHSSDGHHEDHHHHSHKWFERNDGYVYSQLELDGYRIPQRNRDKCVNFYVPFYQCQRDLPLLHDLVHPSKGKNGKCEKLFTEFDNCITKLANYETQNHVANAFFNNYQLASKLGLSGTYQANSKQSPATLQL